MSGMTEEPRWLDDDERAAWMALASALMRLGPALNAQLLRDAGLTHFEYTVMASLSEVPDRTMRMSHLADLSDGLLPRLSQVVTRLERRGWVTRRTDPTDGRYTLATLTDDGMAKVVASAPGHVEEVRRIVFDPLTRAQVAQLTRIGERLNDALGAERCTGGSRTADPC
jgi:DNA-binding MarR family transcriptional regulator